MWSIKINNPNTNMQMEFQAETQQECLDWLEYETSKPICAFGKPDIFLTVDTDPEKYPQGAEYIENVEVEQLKLDENGNVIEEIQSNENGDIAVPVYEIVTKHKVKIPAEFTYELVDVTQELRDEKLKEDISKMIEFGLQIIKDFSFENSKMGIRADDMVRTVRINTESITNALIVGDLLGAVEEMQDLDTSKKDAKYVTDERMSGYINRIVDFMNNL